jgi:hypothetical protein
VEGRVEEARAAGELRADTDAGQLAFELIALMESANALSVLHGENIAYRRARVGIAARLRAVAVDASSVPQVG